MCKIFATRGRNEAKGLVSEEKSSYEKDAVEGSIATTGVVPFNSGHQHFIKKQLHGTVSEHDKANVKFYRHYTPSYYNATEGIL